MEEMRMTRRRVVLFVLLLFALICVSLVYRVFWRAGFEREGGSISQPNRQRIAQFAIARARQSGTVMIGRIQTAAEIDGVPCSAGWVHFHKSGNLRSCSLDRPAIIQGNLVPKGTWIRLNPDSSLAWCSFPADTEIQGYVCRGGIGGAEGVATGFYPDGRLHAFFPRIDTMVGGVLCGANSSSAVYLHRDESLKECTVAGETVLEGRTLFEGQRVNLDARGHIHAVSNPSWFTRARIWAKKLL
jgi:hypothetical protein